MSLPAYSIVKSKLTYGLNNGASIERVEFNFSGGKDTEKENILHNPINSPRAFYIFLTKEVEGGSLPTQKFLFLPIHYFMLDTFEFF